MPELGKSEAFLMPTWALPWARQRVQSDAGRLGSGYWFDGSQRGWKSAQTPVTCYQRPDEGTMREVLNARRSISTVGAG